MKFMPYEYLRLESTLAVADIHQKLERVIEPKRHFKLFEKSSKPYEGRIEGTRFEVSRILDYRNALRPNIVGHIQAQPQGSTVSISMKPDLVAIVFMLLFLGGVGLSFFMTLAPVLSSSVELSTATWHSLISLGAIFIALYVFFLAFFKFESAKSKDFLLDLLDAREVEEL